MPEQACDQGTHPSDQILNEYCQGSPLYFARVEQHLGDRQSCCLKVVQIVRATVQNERDRQRRKLP